MKWFYARRASGFTLIELLVVIAVIAILAAILFPVFAQAREKARQSTCISHLKNICMAHLLYVQDNDEVLPPFNINRCPPEAIYPDQGPVNKVSWVEYLQPYLKNRQVLFCPSARTDEPSRQSALGANLAHAYWLADYGLATWGPIGDGTQGAPYQRYPGSVVATRSLPTGACDYTSGLPPCGSPVTCLDLMTLARLVRPSETVAYADGFVYALAPGVVTAMGEARHQMVSFSRDGEMDSHSGIVVGFIDGHAKRMSLGDMISVVDDGGFWRRRYISADR